MRMGLVAWDGPGGWEMDGTDGMGWDGLCWDVPQSGDLCRASCANPQLLYSALTCFANMLGSGDTSLPQTALRGELKQCSAESPEGNYGCQRPLIIHRQVKPQTGPGYPAPRVIPPRNQPARPCKCLQRCNVWQDGQTSNPNFRLS